MLGRFLFPSRFWSSSLACRTSLRRLTWVECARAFPSRRCLADRPNLGCLRNCDAADSFEVVSSRSCLRLGVIWTLDSAHLFVARFLEGVFLGEEANPGPPVRDTVPSSAAPTLQEVLPEKAALGAAPVTGLVEDKIQQTL